MKVHVFTAFFPRPFPSLFKGRGVTRLYVGCMLHCPPLVVDFPFIDYTIPHSRGGDCDFLACATIIKLYSLTWQTMPKKIKWGQAGISLLKEWGISFYEKSKVLPRKYIV